MSYLRLFNESYARVALDPIRQAELVRRFTECVNGRTPELAEACRQDGRLDLFLRRFLLQLGAFCSTGYNPTATMCRLSQGLQANGASAADLQCWLDCLLDSVAAVDPPFPPEAEAAWRVALSPAFTFMQLPQSHDAA